MIKELLNNIIDSSRGKDYRITEFQLGSEPLHYLSKELIHESDSLGKNLFKGIPVKEIKSKNSITFIIELIRII